MTWRVRLTTLIHSQVFHLAKITNIWKWHLKYPRESKFSWLWNHSRQLKLISMFAIPDQGKVRQRSQKGENLDETLPRDSSSDIQGNNAPQKRQNPNLSSQSPDQPPTGVYETAHNTKNNAPDLRNLSLRTSTPDFSSENESYTTGDSNQTYSYPRQNQGRGRRKHLPRNDQNPIPKTESHNPSHMPNSVPHNVMYNHPVSQQYPSQYVSAAPSPVWPYDAPPTQYNDFNFFAPTLSPPGDWQPQPSFPTPLPVPSASGIIRIDQPLAASPLRIAEPTQDYILTASIPPYRLDQPMEKLLILDLNGTLLYRPRNPQKDRSLDMRQASTRPILRPHLPKFISYIFRNFKIMVWSSAAPNNVKAMVAAVTTPEQLKQVIAIWGRDTFGLSKKEYRRKAITIKDLTKIFKDKKIQKYCKTGTWDAGNTILLDDSVIKASFQPHNHVCVPEFVWNEMKAGDVQDDALWQVAGYLEELRYQGHVARFIKQNPFRLGGGWNGMCLD
jgi:hypothetical protein